MGSIVTPNEKGETVRCGRLEFACARQWFQGLPGSQSWCRKNAGYRELKDQARIECFHFEKPMIPFRPIDGKI
jgi:hypothetical protein